MTTPATAAPLDPSRPVGRRAVGAAGVVILLLAWLYAALVPAGLPYDEPSHWQNVVHIADTGSLPVVGDPDVSYEAVQGPVAYVLDAGVLAALESVGLDREAAFVGVRMVQSLWLVGLLVVMVALVGRLLPRAPAAAVLLAGATAAGSPILVAIGSSIQNDVPALTLALLSLWLFLDDDASSPRRAAAVGALLGLAFLAKASVWPLGVVLVGVVLARREWARAAVLVGVGLVVSGWWVVRNVALYGSLTGNDAVSRAGTDFPPVGLSPSTVVDMVRATTTFLWVPVEYWRNVVGAPAVVDVVVLAATVVPLAMGAWLLREVVSRDLVVVVVLAVLSVIVWVVVNTVVSNASFRLAYLCLPAWAALVGVVVSRFRAGRWLLAAVLVALHGWSLVALAGASFSPMGL